MGRGGRCVSAMASADSAGDLHLRYSPPPLRFGGRPPLLQRGGCLTNNKDERPVGGPQMSWLAVARLGRQESRAGFFLVTDPLTRADWPSSASITPCSNPE